jgi:tetratricopeptide (TPR) repeat protein
MTFAQERVDIFADPENLKVLPEDISSDDLSNTMRGFAMGLGARCETCHVGEPNTPLHTFDFASDEKEMKQKARLMLQMVNEINGELVPRLNDVEKASRVAVRCMTCHRGQQQPNLIEDVLDQQLADNGIEGALSEYRKLREEYYGSHSYDFSEFVLPMYAQSLTENDQLDAAIAFAKLNANYFPESYYSVFVLAELYAATEQAKLAIDSYTRAIELNPRAERTLGPKIEALGGD